MRKVLVVDDDPSVLMLISEILRKEFFPIVAAGGKECISKAISENPELILLDVNMPGMDGFEICGRLRTQPSTRHIPIIMLTGESSLESIVRALKSGADDYIQKPFQPKELLARIRARLRRDESYQWVGDEVRVGNLVLNSKLRQVLISDKSVRLTEFEIEMLRYFLNRTNQVIDRSQLLSDLWPDKVVADRTVDTHVANLRRKIKEFDHSLETVYGNGYILRGSDKTEVKADLPESSA